MFVNKPIIQESNLALQIGLNNGGPLDHCGKDDLTDNFGWFLQVLLAGLAFTCLIVKRFCEPKYERRPWLIWFYDTSKQGMGALVIHLANVYLAGMFHGDPCTWYIINFLLDSSLGLCIIYFGIRLSQFLSKIKKWEALNFGEYGKPPSVHIWLVQCGLYIALMVVVKIIITLLIQLDFWDDVRDLILSPITNPRVELAVVMLIIPFFVNVLMFWVTDNFLMRHKGRNDSQGEPNILHTVKVQYKKLTKEKPNDSESDVLLSGDDELLGTNENLQKRLGSTTLTI